MQSVKADCFLSCSFREEDKEVIAFFAAIAEGLDLNLVNVSNAWTSTPPEVASRLIDGTSLLIALCTRRDKLASGRWIMPQAVQDEMGIAFGKNVPILMFIEGGVVAVGFKSNFGTYTEFTRDQLSDTAFIGKVVNAIHNAKLNALGDNGNALQTGIEDAFSEYVHHQVELKESRGDYLWTYATQKRLVYTQNSRRTFPCGVWPTVNSRHSDNAEVAKWECRLIASSSDIKLTEHIEKQTPDCIEVMLKPEPHPDKGDYIEYATYSQSRYINAVWADETAGSLFVHLDSGDFECADGLMLIHRTKHAMIEFRFPESYGLKAADFHPFVGAYSTRVDYIVPSEVERAMVTKMDFAGNVSLLMKIESPLPGHIYGFAWHPQPRPKVDEQVAAGED